MILNLLQRLILSQLISQEQGSPLEARMTILRGVAKRLRLTADEAKAYSFEPAPGQFLWDEGAMKRVESTVELDEKERKVLGAMIAKCERMTVAQAEVLEPLFAEFGLIA
jgi:hypothetical protein